MAMGEEKMAKGLSIGKSIRKRLSDITNFESQHKSSSSCLDKEYIDHLLKENAGLLKLITEKNKVIEMNGTELQRVRVLIQKIQLQNLSLAQSNNHMKAELDLSRKKLKELQHQLACKDAVLRTMSSELQELDLSQKKLKELQHQLACRDAVLKTMSSELQVKRETNDQKCESKDGEKALTNQQNASRRVRPGRSRSISQLTTVEVSETANKRPRVRRQSARFITSQEHEADENLFEIKDLIMHEDCGPRSFGRPSRRAAEKVQSYKEVPLNVKMRRPE